MCTDNVLVSDPQKIVEYFARNFSNSFTNTNINPNYTPANAYPGPNLLFVKNNTSEEVLRAISKLKAGLTPGPNLIPSFIVSN